MSKPSTPVIAGMKPVPGTRGAITFDMARCDECQDCERVCPSVAIKVYPEEKKIEYSPFKCLYCWLCVDNCMQRAISGSDYVQEPAYTKVVKVFETKK